LSEKDEMTNAAEKAWDKWHDSVGFADEDDYIPTMSPLWRIAFEAGAEWEAKGEK
jgi:hypothetical protein